MISSPINSNTIWILADKRPGTFSQSLGLAEEISRLSSMTYQVINLEYSALSLLPNFLCGNSFYRVTKETRKQITDFKHLPALIISAGRRSAPIALYLKKLSGNKTRVIQIMNPEMNFGKFDFVLLPKHDRVPENTSPNLITTIGSLTRVNNHLIDLELQKFLPTFSNITQERPTKIALVVGGSSNKTVFDIESAKTLAQTMSAITNKMNATLLILDSRRTSDEIYQTLKFELKCHHHFFHWPDVKDNNPYLAMLGYADFFVVTGDSSSMISECCSTGKPVYIFDDRKISSNKHRFFHQDLVKENSAKFLKANLQELEKFFPKRLEETKRIAKVIVSYNKAG